MNGDEIINGIPEWSDWVSRRGAVEPQGAASLSMEYRLEMSGGESCIMHGSTNPDSDPPTKRTWRVERCMSALKRCNEQWYAAVLGQVRGGHRDERMRIARMAGYTRTAEQFDSDITRALAFVIGFNFDRELDEEEMGI